MEAILGREYPNLAKVASENIPLSGNRAGLKVNHEEAVHIHGQAQRIKNGGPTIPQR